MKLNVKKQDETKDLRSTSCDLYLISKKSSKCLSQPRFILTHLGLPWLTLVYHGLPWLTSAQIPKFHIFNFDGTSYLDLPWLTLTFLG